MRCKCLCKWDANQYTRHAPVVIFAVADPGRRQGHPSWSKFFHFHTVLKFFKIIAWNTLLGIPGSATDLACFPFPVESSFFHCHWNRFKITTFYLFVLFNLRWESPPKRGGYFPTEICSVPQSSPTSTISPLPAPTLKLDLLSQWLASRCNIMAMVVTMRMRQTTQKKSRSTTLPSAFHSSIMWVSASSCFILSVMKRRFCRISSSVESPADQKTVQELLLKATTIDEQECIPVGCVPAARWPYAAVCFPWGWCLLGGCLLGGGVSWGVWSGGWWLLQGGPVWGVVVSGLGGKGGGYIPACTEADTPHGQNSWHTLAKILPWPNFVAAGKN